MQVWHWFNKNKNVTPSIDFGLENEEWEYKKIEGSSRIKMMHLVKGSIPRIKKRISY